MPYRLPPYAAAIVFVTLCTCISTTSTQKKSQLPAAASADEESSITEDRSENSKTDASPTPPDPSPAYEMSVDAVDDAVTHASSKALGRQKPVYDGRDLQQILNPDFETAGSVSLGTIREGELKNAASLTTQGQYHEVIENHRPRGTYYGTTDLIEAIKQAAQTVYNEHGGAPLRIGNLGYEDGGRIPWSNSHQAGRDADLAFYSVDDQGRSVATPGLIEFDDTGRAIGHDLYFDIPRNWTLVRALLNDESINIHWLFISEGLKYSLLEYALEQDESSELIERAARILHQPTDAPPHADHFHLRIGCSQTDRLLGCVDWGPQWEWYDWHEDALFARTMAVQRAFTKGDSPTVRAQAIDYLVQIRSPFGPETALQFGVHDKDPSVQNRAYELLEELPIRSKLGLHQLSQVLKSNDIDDEQRQILYDALRRAQPQQAADLALERYLNRELSEDERAWAIESLAHRMKPELVPQLIDALGDEPSPRLRQLLAAQLRRVTARTDGVDWSQQPQSDEHHDALEQWRLWWQEIDPERQAMLKRMLAGYGIDRWKDLEAIDDLIDHLGDAEEHYERYNLNLIISDWTGRWAPREWDRDGDAHRFWSRWWNRNRERVLDDSPPPPWEK